MGKEFLLSSQSKIIDFSLKVLGPVTQTVIFKKCPLKASKEKLLNFAYSLFWGMFANYAE
jgi:hypothetical protein